MGLLFTRTQIMFIFVNLAIILVGVGLTILSLKLAKLKSKQSILIFILFMIYWIPTLMCRDYTGMMMEHTPIKWREWLLVIPLCAYGLVGLIWRPLVDIFSIKMKSRKNVIFIALALQLATFIPFVIIPNTTTNIIQSIGCGIGASCIGLFNLMFDETETKKTVFNTVTILAIPPILAQFFASAIESMVSCAVPTVYTHSQYTNTMLSLWSIGSVLIIACFIIAIFIKPRPQLLYVASKEKTQIKSKHSIFAFVLLCLAGLFVMMIRWITAGPTAGIQLTYISAHFGIDSKYYEGYTGLVYTVGQLVGTIITTIVTTRCDVHKDRAKTLLILGSCVAAWTYCITGGFCLDVGSFIGLLAISGLSYGLIFPIIISVAVQHMFTRTKYQTPVGVLNTSMAVGIVIGSFIVTYYKAPVFNQIQGFSTMTFTDFRQENWHMMLICIVLTALVLICYLISYYIFLKYPEKKITRKNVINLMADTEM